MEAKRWLGAVHEWARTVRGSVTTAAEPPTVGRNYWRIGVRLSNGPSMVLLLNDDAGLVAASRPDPGAVVLTFVDIPHAEVFTRAGYRVAEPRDLDRPLTDADARTPADRREIAYHRPERPGDLLFNWFD